MIGPLENYDFLWIDWCVSFQMPFEPP